MLPAWEIKMLEAELEKRKQEREVKDNEAITRLAEYEGSGLSPEDCTAYAKGEAEKRIVVFENYEHLREIRELMQAKAEGRLMVLPCKSGDTVYCITSPYNVTTDEEDFEKPKQVYEAVVGSMTFYSNSSQIRLNHNGKFITHYFQLTDFGKTVFLTEMEAKEVLKCQK